MPMLFGLCSLVGLSLFLSHVLRRSSATMPFVAVSLAIVFFTGFGVLGVFWGGMLRLAGWLWYTLCLAAVVFLLVKLRRRVLSLFTPGLVFFAAGSLAFVLFCLATRPMFTHWDEFTFWGTAAKTTGASGLLYTQAPGNLIAKSYPPGLIVFGYMMQFFVPGGFGEATTIAGYGVLALACCCVPLAVWDKHKTTALIMGAAMFLLPFFFSLNTGGGQMQWAYLVCMADTPMALFFGAALCLYFGGKTAPAEDRGARLFLPFAAALAALVCIKDMGLALALMALFVAMCDAIFCEQRQIGFFRLRGGKAIAATCAVCLVAVLAAYLAWYLHMGAALAVNRFNLGSAGESKPMLDMILSFFGMLAGQGRTEQFNTVWREMLRALLSRPVALVGGGLLVLAGILAVSALAWGLAATRRQRRRALVFTLGMALCFAGFYLFNIFTYSVIFKPQEALELKDYARYISPVWLGWLMAAMLFLCRSATNAAASFRRLRVARGVSALALAGFAGSVMLLGNWQGNFLRVSPAYYGQRHSVKAVLAGALAEGMQPDDVVYIISQGDDGSRFYMLGYEMPARRALVFNGILVDISGQMIPDEAGMPQFVGNVAATLIPHGSEYPPLFGVECSREELTTFLWQEGATHLLVDMPDEYIIEEFGPLFSDGLAGWDATNPYARGHRYYKLNWQDGGELMLTPEGGGAA